MNIATISAGFEKGDFLVREEQGNRVYFDFFEEVSVFGATAEPPLRSDYSPPLWPSCRHSTTSPIRDTPACPERTKSTGLI